MAQPKCFQERCNDVPKYICDCASSIYICTQHVGPHIMDKKSMHNVLKLGAKPNLETVRSVRSFLENYLGEASSVKNTILEKSSYKVSKIHTTIQEYLKQLNYGFKLANKWLNDLNNLRKIQRDTNDPFYQALLLSREAAINKIKPLIFTISDNQDILCKLFTEVDIESIVDKQINQKFDIFLKQYLKNTEKICSDKVKDLEISLKKSTDTRIKALESENIKEINEIKAKFTNINYDISQHKKYFQNFKQNYDELEKRFTEIAQQILNEDAENKKEINEIKANISNFNCDWSLHINKIQDLNENCKQKINEIEKKLSEKVDSKLVKIKSENEFLLKEGFAEISNLGIETSKINKILSTYQEKYQDIENKFKKEISTLSQKINEIKTEAKPKAQKADDKTVANQVESKAASHLNKNAIINTRINTLEKSQTEPNISFTYPKEKSSLLNSELVLAIENPAIKCSNLKHDKSYHISGCIKSHCGECLLSYYSKLKGQQNNFYCHHGAKLLALDIKRLEEMELRSKKYVSSKDFYSPRADNLGKRIEKIPQTFERNAQTPTAKYIPHYASNEKSAIPIRSSEVNMHSEKVYPGLYNPKIDSRKEITPSKKSYFIFNEGEKKKG